jgi:hypothetical protein
MEALAELFNNPLTPWIISSALLGITFAVAIRCWWHGRCLKLLVDQIRRDSGISLEHSIYDEAERWNEYALERFEVAKVKLQPLAKKNQPLAWQTLMFLNRCEPVQEEGSDRQRLETAVSPVDVIRLSEHLFEHNVQVSLYRAFPNYLVGIGLCITFLGLAVVIGKSSKVLQNSKPPAPIHSVENTGSKSDKPESKKEPEQNSDKELSELLKAASSKFWSSLTAVACSILYGMWFRNRSQQMEREVGVLARDLGRCVRVISSDELQYESIQRLRRCEEYQSITANGIGLLKSGLESTQSSSAEQHRILLEKLGAVADGLVGKLGQLGDELGTKIGSMGSQVAGSLSQVNEKAFADIAKQMTESLHKATEVHLKAIAERLEAVSATLARLPGEFDALVGLVQENTTSIATAFATAVQPIETSLAAASNSAQDVASKFATLPDALEPARAAAKDLTSAASTISEMVGRIYSQNDTVVKRWEELSGLILAIDTQLAGAVERVGSVFPAYAEKLQDFSHKWESAMVAALGGLSANIRDLSRSHEELRTQRTVWHDSAEAVARSVDAVNNHVTRFTEALAAHGEAQKLALQSAIVTNEHLAQDSQNSGEGTEESSEAEIISTTIPA